MLQLIILTIIIIGFAVLALGVGVFFSKKRSFPEMRISKNKELRKRKIYCPETEQKIIDKNISQSSSCSGCM